jgi:hypothetical protein
VRRLTSAIDGALTATRQTCGAERELKRAGKVKVNSSLKLLSPLNSSARCLRARARSSTNTPFPMPVASISPNSLIKLNLLRQVLQPRDEGCERVGGVLVIPGEGGEEVKELARDWVAPDACREIEGSWFVEEGRKDDFVLANGREVKAEGVRGGRYRVGGGRRRSGGGGGGNCGEVGEL